MATRSLIAIEHSEGRNAKYRTIYCHFDGYPSHVGRILTSEYKDANKVIELIELGDLSYLSEGKACAYHRDKGEPYNTPHMLESMDDLKGEAFGCHAEFVYIFNGDEWECLDLVKNEFVDLYNK